MSPQQRTKLHFGPYRTPRFKYGSIAIDERRGEVNIVGISDAKIPWPVGKKGRAKSIILYKSLLRAVRHESTAAIQHWWGVKANTVWQWRRAVGIGQNNEGTMRLRRLNGHSEYARRGLRECLKKSRDPIRRAKIAATKIGKPRPLHVIEAMRQGRLGKPHTAEARRKISQALRSRRQASN